MEFGLDVAQQRLEFGRGRRPRQIPPAGDRFDQLEIANRLTEQAGRDPRSIRRAASLSLSEHMDEVRANAERLVGDGVDYIICSWPAQGKQRVEEFWTTIAPSLQDVA